MSTAEAAQLLDISHRTMQWQIRHRRFPYVTKLAPRPVGGPKRYVVNLHYLPPDVQQRYWSRRFGVSTGSTTGISAGSTTSVSAGSTTGVSASSTTGVPHLEDKKTEVLLLQQAPSWQRRRAARWLRIFSESEWLSGTALKAFVGKWNSKHRGEKISCNWLKKKRRQYERKGITALLPKWDWRKGESIVPDAAFNYFRNVYLDERGVSLHEAWLETLGYYHEKHDRKASIDTFPKAQSFYYRLLYGKGGMPAAALYLARYGEAAYNRKYGAYIDRNFEEVGVGEAWVADHHQLDAGCIIRGKLCFPWVTAWSCFKSRKRLAWFIHPEPPNSDHIFQSLQMAIERHGMPHLVYIDNGKDFRAKDFNTGRVKKGKIEVSEEHADLLTILNIEHRFALPYNAQTKNIERDFKQAKEMFAKRLTGYRGGNVTERPEKLKKQQVRGQLLDYDTYAGQFAEATEWMNNTPSQGKVHQGRSPNEVWAHEKIALDTLSTEAMKLLFMRSSRALAIGKNGVYDAEIGQTYWGEWMEAYKGTRVYLRRNPDKYETAYCFDGQMRYIGDARIGQLTAPALAKTELDKQKLKAALATKKRSLKKARELVRTETVDPVERLYNRKAGVHLQNRGEVFDDPENSNEIKTEMDVVHGQIQENERAGNAECDKAISPELPDWHEIKPPLFNTVWEKREWEEKQEQLRKLREEDKEEIAKEGQVQKKASNWS